MKDRIYRGMTLTEILVVVSILVILTVLITFVYRTQILKANDAKRKGDLHLIQAAVEEYEKDHDCYPPAELVVCHPGDGLKPYLTQIPCDPVSKTSYYYEPEDDSCPGWYRIFADLENTKDNSYVAGLGPGGSYNFVVSSSNAPTATPLGTTPTPTSSPAPGDNFWGCFNGQCQPISGPNECNPNYQSPDCYGQCQFPANECRPF